MLKTTLTASLLLVLSMLGPVAATSQTIPVDITQTFGHFKVTAQGTLTLDSTAKTLTGSVTMTVVDTNTGGTVFQKTFIINAAYHSFNPRFVLNISTATDSLALSCSVIDGATACIVSKNPNLTGSGQVNIVDLGMLAAAFGSSTGSTRYQALADLDGNGSINIIDAGILAADFGLPVQS